MSARMTSTLLIPAQSALLSRQECLEYLSLLIWRVLLVGWRSEDTFTLAFSGGIAGMLLFQMIVNIGMVLGVMPITGLPLPFVSYGGSNLLTSFIAFGLLQNVHIRRDKIVF